MTRKQSITIILAMVLVGIGFFARHVLPEHSHFKNKIKKRVEVQKNEDLPYEPTNSKSNILLMSWNIQNFGKSKSAQTLQYIAKTMKNMDIVAIQEVSSGPAGPQTVAQLADELNRIGSKWLYVVSEHTTGTGMERYAYLWKPNRVKLIGEPFLEKSLDKEIDREPFLARFVCKNEQILLVNFHAVPKAKHPAHEIQLLPRIQSKYPNEKIIMMGDFNLSQKDPAFDKLKQRGLKPALINTKTSLRMHSNPAAPGQYFSEEYDNFYFNPEYIEARRSHCVDIVKDFRSVEDAHRVSDHVPIILEFTPRSRTRDDFQR